MRRFAEHVHVQLCITRLQCLITTKNTLQVASESVGLYGRNVVTFELATHGRRSKEPLPSSLIGSGNC